jgi:hypothetical protein
VTVRSFVCGVPDGVVRYLTDGASQATIRR